MKIRIRLIETDNLDPNNAYYLYEVNTGTEHFYTSTSDEEMSYLDQDEQLFVNDHKLYGRDDFTDREWEIAKYLFRFLWDSCNGTNTGCAQEIYEEDGFTVQEMEDFVDKFDQGGLSFDETDINQVEIYWDYFATFDLTKCNPFED